MIKPNALDHGQETLPALMVKNRRQMRQMRHLRQIGRRGSHVGSPAASLFEPSFRRKTVLKTRSKQAARPTTCLTSDVEVWLAIVARVVARIAQQRRARKVKA